MERAHRSSDAWFMSGIRTRGWSVCKDNELREKHIRVLPSYRNLVAVHCKRRSVPCEERLRSTHQRFRYRSITRPHRTCSGRRRRNVSNDTPCQHSHIYSSVHELCRHGILLPGLLTIHLRTISTNDPHPLAQKSVLRCRVFFPISSAFIQIVDDIVGMLFWAEPDGPRIMIWSWRNGKSLVVGIYIFIH